MPTCPCGDKSDNCTGCSGLYFTTTDVVLVSERYVGYYTKDGKQHRCKDSGCPIHRDPGSLIDAIANRLAGEDPGGIILKTIMKNRGK